MQWGAPWMWDSTLISRHNINLCGPADGKHGWHTSHCGNVMMVQITCGCDSVNYSDVTGRQRVNKVYRDFFRADVVFVLCRCKCIVSHNKLMHVKGIRTHYFTNGSRPTCFPVKKKKKIYKDVNVLKLNLLFFVGNAGIKRTTATASINTRNDISVASSLAFPSVSLTLPLLYSIYLIFLHLSIIHGAA